MKAPSPPPTMPSLILPPSEASLRPSIIVSYPLDQAERACDLPLVDLAAGEVVERLLGHANDVLRDEFGALARAVLGMLQAALPFQHRPRRIAVLRHLGEDAAEIDLAVAERAEAARPVDPRRIPRINALLAGR